MSAEPTLIDRFLELPRVIQWVAYGAAVLVLALIYVDYVQPAVRDLNTQADEMLAQIERAKRNENAVPRTMQETISVFGAIEAPAGVQESAEALSAAVNRIIERYDSVTDYRLDTRPASNLPSGALATLVRGGKKAQRVTNDIRFNANEADVASIVADLEDDPAIESVASLRIQRAEGSRRVGVQISVEAWAISRKGAS